MDEREELQVATAKMQASLEVARGLQAKLETERQAIERVRRSQRLWWLAVFLLGVGAGFLIAEWIIDPITIIVPSGGIDV